MSPKLFCLLLTSLFLQFSMGSPAIDYGLQNFSVGITVNISLTRSSQLNSVIYYEEIILSPLSVSEINVDLKIAEEEIVNNFGFAIIQVHSHLFNVTLGYKNKEDQWQYYNGTNLGIMVDVSKRIYLWNLNYFTTVKVAIANVIYDDRAPIPGGCSLEVESHIAQLPKVTEVEKMLQVDIHSASEQNKLCLEANLTYESRYMFLEKDDFSSRSYFKAIKALLEPNVTSGLVAKKPAPGSVNRILYMAVPGTGIVFNTIVRNSYGIAAAYVPAVSYSCIPYQWNNNCSILSNYEMWSILAVVLIIIGIIRTFVITKIPAINLFLRFLPVSAYILYISLIANKKSIGAGFLILINISASILITYIGEKFKITKILSSFLTQLIYGWLLALLISYPLVVNLQSFSSNIVYWIVFVTILIIPFLVMISSFSCQFLSKFMDITIDVFSAIIGILILTKSNMILILLNNIYRIQNDKYRFVNGYPIPTGTDFIIFLGMICGIIIGIILHHHKLFLFGNHIEIPNVRGPYITRWANNDDSEGSDEVFETPRTNNRYFKRLAKIRKCSI